ncbi:MAG: cytochrome P450 [Anaerolineales bacterium]|nr:cytochrome P450 [Anaerolineales bacterium]
MVPAIPLSPQIPPTMPGMPFLGSATDFVSSNGLSTDFLTRVQREHGDVVHFKAMKQSFYLVSDPALVRKVLLEQVQEFLKPDALPGKPRGLSRFLGRSILTSGLEEWRPQRKLIQPLMQHNHIAKYADTMVGMGERLLALWRDGETRDLHADMTQVTMWIIAETMFGLDVTQTAELEEVGRSAQKIVIDELVSPFPSWLVGRDKKSAQINAILTNLVTQFLADRRAQNNADRHDLLSILLETRDENGQPMSDQFLRDNILTMFLAGHETTANTLTWALYYLAQNPAILQTLEHELDTVLAGQRAPTLADLPFLPYTLMVIKETMRIQPIVPMIPRTLPVDTSLGNYHLQAGSFVLISPYVLHHDPRHWSDPETFDPTRFSAENEPTIEKYTYLPFGGGPRICIGNHFALMEAHFILALLVSRYRLTLVPGANVIPLRRITCEPKDGMPMLVKRR